MCPQQELGHELPVCPLLMSRGCCVPAPVPTAAPCCSGPSSGGGMLRTCPWKQQNNPPFHLAVGSSLLLLPHGRRERAALPLPKLPGLKRGTAAVPAPAPGFSPGPLEEVRGRSGAAGLLPCRDAFVRGE